MNEELREALGAVKQGRREKARLILAEYLRRDPQNVPAWVLLSKLAATQVQKAAFLRKILELDPEHAYARQTLAEMSRDQPAAGAVDAPSETGPAAEDTAFQEDDLEAEKISAEMVADTGMVAEAPAEEGGDEEIFDQNPFEPFDFDEEVPFDVEPSLDEVDDEEDSDWLTDDRFPDDAFEEEPDWLAAEVFEDEPAGAPEGLAGAGDTFIEAPPAQTLPETVVEEDDEELPAWLRSDEDDWLLDEDVDVEHAVKVPDVDDAAASEKAARLSAAMAAESAAPAPTAQADEGSGRGWLLPVLLILAAVIFLVLVYAVVTLMP